MFCSQDVCWEVVVGRAAQKVGGNGKNPDTTHNGPKKMALTMTLSWDRHCPQASNKRGNITATTSPDLLYAALAAL